MSPFRNGPTEPAVSSRSICLFTQSSCDGAIFSVLLSQHIGIFAEKPYVGLVPERTSKCDFANLGQNPLRGIEHFLAHLLDMGRDLLIVHFEDRAVSVPNIELWDVLSADSNDRRHGPVTKAAAAPPIDDDRVSVRQEFVQFVEQGLDLFDRLGSSEVDLDPWPVS